MIDTIKGEMKGKAVKKMEWQHYATTKNWRNIVIRYLCIFDVCTYKYHEQSYGELDNTFSNCLSTFFENLHRVI